MSPKSPIKTLSWFPNGDIRLILATEEAPELRIERGSPESIPFLALLYEVMLRNNLNADKEKARMDFQEWRRSLPFVAGALKDRETHARPQDPPFPEKEAPRSPTRGGASLGPKNVDHLGKFRKKDPPGLEEELARVAAIREKVNAKRGDKRPVAQTPKAPSHQPEDGPPDDYYENMAFEAGLNESDLPSPPPSSPEKTKQKLTEPAEEAVKERVAPDYRALSQDPKHWISGFHRGAGGHIEKIKLGDCSGLNVSPGEPIHALIRESFDLAQTYTEEFEKIEAQQKAEKEKPVEKQHQIMRWPDGENGHRRFAIIVDDRQVPLQVSEKVGEGLVQMLENKEIEFITALHFPNGEETKISHVKTKHFESLIPAEEAANMAIKEFFPNTYPAPDTEIDSKTDFERAEEAEAVRKAYESEMREDEPSLSHPEVSLESEASAPKAPDTELEPEEEAPIPVAFDDEDVPDHVLEANAEAYSSETGLETPEFEEMEIPSHPEEETAGGVETQTAVIAETAVAAVEVKTKEEIEPGTQPVSKKIKIPVFPKIKVPEVEDGYAVNPLIPIQKSGPDPEI